MQKLSLIQLNIERDKHLDRVVPFLKEKQPEVVCLQEVFERDVPLLSEAAGGTAYFVPKMIWKGLVEGICIISRLPFVKTESIQYAGAPDVRVFINGTAEEKHATMRYMLAVCTVEKEGTPFTLTTTHFTWTPNGEASDFQREDMKSLLSALLTVGEYVITGDFNAPRHNPDGTKGEIFSLLSSVHTDDVPTQYETSIDLQLHRSGHLPDEHMDKKMVDGIFSTPAYEVSDVEMICGLSDHCALLADISKE